ncbi:phage tail protein [Mailhella massiliensis]|uniref:phage tail-collar fiber domain-containing protein n=1 Tax=Mailhella massiliensis TaxID=1903261 RepID=UPI00097CEF55|nr:phage tail protein [Mailhella massiliensis]
MPSVPLIVTDAGIAEVINAEANGTAPVKLTEIGLGSGQYTATTGQTGLVSEFKRLDTVAGGGIGDNTLHVSVTDESDDTYTVHEIGLFTESGTLFAVYAQSQPIIQKASASWMMLSLDIALVGVSVDSVTFGDTNFFLPSATTEMQGIVELATDAETQTGTDTSRAVTPKALASRTATESRTGIAEIATQDEANAGTDDSRMITPKKLAGRTATDARAGIVKLATEEEVQDGTDTSKAVTPAGLASRTATDTRAGIVELATAAETQAGKDTTRAVTPARLASRTATESRTGLAEIATQDEVDAGTDDTRIVSPKKLKAVLDGRKATATPKVAGTGSVGKSAKYALEDHVHPEQEDVSGSSGSCTGNAATATKLQNAKTIDGVSFNGSAAITHYGTCSTAADTAAKTVALSGFALVTGAVIFVRFTVTNTASNPTLNVNGTGAKAVQYRNAAISAGHLAANRVYVFVYDGTAWELVGDINTDTNTRVTQNVTGANGTYPILLGYTANNTASRTEEARYAADVKVNPSTDKILAKGLEGQITQTTWVGAAKEGGSLIEGDVSAGGFAPFIRYKSENGVFVLNGHSDGMLISYLTDANVEAGTNKVEESLEFTETGQLVSTGGFKGALSGNVTGDLKGDVTGDVKGDLTGNVTGNVTGSSGSCKGNSATATKLQTARTIDGVDFNGSAPITHYGTCSTAAGTAAKTVALTGFKLVTGAVVFVRFSATNTAANPTLNVNNTGAKAIQYRNAAISAGYLAANRTYAFVYDGSSYELVGDIDTNTTYSAASETRSGIVELATAAEVQAGTDTVRAVTPKGLVSRTATESRTGLAEIATQAEVDAGTDNSRIITPKKLAESYINDFRKSLIGSLFYFGRATLPSGFMKPDGSLVRFDDYPELEEAYNSGAFNGMILEANASATDKNTWAGKWVKHSQGLGLYLPRLSGLFLRNAGTAGRSEASGLPSLYGRASFLYREDSNTEGVFSLVDGKGSIGNLVSPGSGSLNIFWADLALNATSVNSIFGASSEVRPPNVNLVSGIYLGCPA